MIKIYEKVKVKHFSLTAMQAEGFDIEDQGDLQKNFYDALAKKGILKLLTSRQRQVVTCLTKGMDRTETARHLLVSRQSVNQIIPRIRKRLQIKGFSYGTNNNRGAKPRIPLFSSAS